MKKVLVPIATGFEELEAITVVDLLRRAGIKVVIASLGEEQLVTASRGTIIKADTTLDSALEDNYDMIVLPGGLPGADHLRDDPRIIQALQHQQQQAKAIAAICAAPKVLVHAGLTKGKHITSFPNAIAKEDLNDCHYLEDAIVIDDNMITSRGPGTAMEFALTIIEHLLDKTTREEVERPLQRH